MTPTIEDVLAKHAKNYKKTVEENEKSLYHLVLNGFEAINFAKEWALGVGHCVMIIVFQNNRFRKRLMAFQTLINIQYLI